MTATEQPTVLDQLGAALERLDEIRQADGWTFRDAARVLGIGHAAIFGIRTRAMTTSALPLLDAYARVLGRGVRVLLVEDDPSTRKLPWRQRMPHGEDPADAHAMAEAWRLQQQLHELRTRAGRSRDEIAAELGTGTLALWRLETSPAAMDAAFTNVMLLARFFG
ncbi:hypothetical protein ABZU76_10995 [Amycolatopsis sp. NPDC005232]|uniref:hypothetical protein n=1 Tax=Amycolatopsis sp. NPDC005232 TaxID=3157027 RepID=UPI0033A40998